MRKLFLLFSIFSVQLFAGEKVIDNQKMNLDVPTSDRFLMTDLVWPSTMGEAHVSLWAGDKVAAVTITIDDNIEEDHEWWLSMQQKYKLDFTWFIVLDWVSNWSKYQILVDAGNEVQSHENKYCDISQETDTKYLTEMKLVKETINQKLTHNQSLTFAYPCGQQRNYLSRSLYIGMRGVTGKMNPANKTNYLDINSRSSTNDAHDLDILLDPKETLWNMSYYRGLASYHYHKVKDKKGTEAFLSAVREKVESLWVSRFSEVMKYGQERDSHTLTVDQVNGDEIKFTLTDEMMDAYFNYPLTVKIRVDNNWKGITSTQNGKKIESKIITNNGNNFAIVKSVPDRGQVVVRKGPARLAVPEVKTGTDQTIADKDEEIQSAINLPLPQAIIETDKIIKDVDNNALEASKPSKQSEFIAKDKLTTLKPASILSKQAISILSETSDQEVYSAGTKNWVGQPSARVGGALATQDAVFIMAYKLPELGKNKYITNATLDINLLSVANSPEGNIDLYGLGYRKNSTVLVSDYYQGAYNEDKKNTTPLQDDFITKTSPVGWKTVDAVGQANLVNYINAQYQLGAKGGSYLFIRLNPDIADVRSYHYWEFSTADSDKFPVLKIVIGNVD